MGTQSLSKPKYVRIVESLQQQIQSGALRSGDRLPADEELAERFGASRNTVIRALCDLRDAGVVERIQGAGTFVAKASGTGRLSCMFIGDGHFDFQTRDSVFGRLEAALDRLLRTEHDAALSLDRPLSENTAEHKQRAVAAAIEQRVAGVFYLPLEADERASELNERWLAQLREAGIAVVLLDQDVVEPPCRSEIDLACMDHHVAGRRVGQHLRDAGAKKVAVLVPRVMPATVRQRVEGVTSALEGTAKVRIVHCGDGAEGREAIASAFHEFKPDAVVGKDDRLAAAAMRVLYRENLRVPDEVMVCGFDNAAIAAELPVPLTSYAQPIEEIAHAAIHLMTSRLQNPTQGARQISVIGRLIERASTRR